MNTFVLEIWDDEGEKCSFYTVKCEDSDRSETDMFFEKYDSIPEYKQVNRELLSFIVYAIGNEHGAIDALFNREENEVIGLPVKGKQKIRNSIYYFPNFPLRLYALKITDSIVVLFNGGVKDGFTNQTSSLHIQWLAACRYAKRIVEAINQRDIIIDNKNRKLKNYDDSLEIIL